MDAFARALLDPERSPPPGITVRAGADPAARFAVYRNNVAASLIEALADTYPVVRQLVGDAFFHAMARDYLRQHPPVSPVLAHYGDRFADFIADFAAAATLPYLPDVARLEWAYVHAFHAADAEAMPPQALAERLAQPALLARTCLRFAPAVQLVRSAYPVVSLWQAHQTDGEVELAGIDLACGEAALLVRLQWTVQIVPTTMQTADFLAALIAGASLGAAFESSGLQGERPLIDIFQCLLANAALTALEPACHEIERTA